MILIVEGNPDIGNVLIHAIQLTTPYQVTLVSDGFQALAALKTLTPQLILLDYHLPGMNGIDLYDTLHAVDELQHIPVVLMSATLPMQEIRERKLHYITKPLELKTLFQMLEKLLAVAHGPCNW